MRNFSLLRQVIWPCPEAVPGALQNYRVYRSSWLFALPEYLPLFWNWLTVRLSDRSRDRRSRSPVRRRHSVGSPPRDKRARSRSNDLGRSAKRKRSPETGKDAVRSQEKKADKKPAKETGSSDRKEPSKEFLQKHKSGEDNGKDLTIADPAKADASTNGDKASPSGKAAEKAAELPLPPPPPRAQGNGESLANGKEEPGFATSSHSDKDREVVSPEDVAKKEDKPKKEKKDKDSKKHKKEKKEKKEKKTKADKAKEKTASPDSNGAIET